ncbi:acyl-CoA synthetase [Haloechinothrix sp. LS1_15]|uniref:acyl-CoA synthetase n=1 Tax=Haloechinothrix sp. LS1_15 TaxID=2652248 RepID=UPI002948A844|nr:acyl-CoA synthetase [Haloechinothrix sp. LS1_15]MDV6013703.1 acyl-CoA synthetase [Haloechinothrix sp. LS1_15]
MGPSSVVKGVAHKAGVLGRSAIVLRRSGLAGRPDQSLRSLRSIRKYGPFAGVIDMAAREHGHEVALADELGELTYSELNNRANALARALSARGIRAGTVMAALCRDHRGLVTAMAASGKLGAKLLMMNTGFAKPQLADVARREGVRALIYDEEFTELLDAVDPAVERYLAWADSDTPGDGSVPLLDELIAGVDDRPVAVPDRPGGFILLTSGTTGTPKGAPRERTSPLASAQFLDRIPLRKREVTFIAAPIFHGTGLSQALLSWALGCKVVLTRSFDPEEALRRVQDHRCTALVLVPTMLQRIIDLPAETLAKYDTSSLRIIFAAGSAIPTDVVTRTMDIFGDVLYNLYGSTEVAVATVATPEELRAAPSTAGKTPVGCRVELYDDNGNRITEPGKVGRIFVGSGLSFTGYTDGRNKEVINGLLASGDVGYFDENGLLFVVGRDDDMIVSGGENVYPLEVENLLTERSDILEAAVVGVDDEEFGQRLKACVVLAEGATTTAEEIKQYVKANLARYKVPRDVEFYDVLPRNATGKLLRHELAAS